MLPGDLHSALVRIAVKKAGPTVGTGFVCHRTNDGILIVTCRRFVDMAAEEVGVGPDGLSERRLWIEGEYEATPLYEPSLDTGIDIAVVRCRETALSAREPLPLGRPLKVGRTRIVCYQGEAPAGKPIPRVCGYKLLDDDATGDFVLLNNELYHIRDENGGSPVINDQWVVAVVLGPAATTPEGEQSTGIILATPIEQLAHEWRERPVALIHGPLAPDVEQALVDPGQRVQAVRARILIAASEPDDGVDLNDEVAIILETVQSRLPPSSSVEVWQWEGGSLRCVYPVPDAADPPRTPACDDFHAVILVAWHNLGPWVPGCAQCALEAAEERTRGTARGHPNEGRPRIIYWRRDRALGSAPDRFDQVEGFIQTLKGLRDVSKDISEYQRDQFAECFGRDFQRLLNRLPKVSMQAASRPAVAPQRAGCPYLGLASYTTKDAPLFNGRTKETSEMRRVLASGTYGFLAVVGASGSGKSSLVRAGLLRRLELNGIPGSSDWRVLDMRIQKGTPPLRTLAEMLYSETGASYFYDGAAAIERDLEDVAGVNDVVSRALADRPAHARLLLFIDQMEELFTLVTDENQRLALIHLLAVAARQERVYVIVTLRADFYHYFLETELAPLATADHLLSVQPPAEDALVAAMYWPAAISGYRFEDQDLFVRILRDAGSSTGALPLLSYALEQLAKAADNGVMTWATYKRMRGVAGVIESQVAKALAGLKPPPSPAVLNEIFRKLVTVDEGGTATKKAVELDGDSAWSPDARRVIEVFVAERLLLTRFRDSDKRVTMVEIAHEKLLTSWTTLARWVKEAQQHLILMRRVEREAGEWQAALAAAPSEKKRLEIDRALWRQEQLDEVTKAMEMLGQTRAELSRVVREFLRPEAERLRRELKRSVDHKRRFEIGERLAELGDKRRGVGLNKECMPDLLWCRVPAGEVTIYEKPGGAVLDTTHVESFFISRYPVTLKQFSVFADVRPEKRDIYNNEKWWTGLDINPREHIPYPQTPETPNHPAQYVSWFQAVAFSRWLSEALGYEIRLPTEWEWVQAATRGKPNYLYPWGPDWYPDRANHKIASNRLMSVGMYPNGASPVGALDMAGNMYEWCLNEFGNIRNIEPSREPRTTRGGAYFVPPPPIPVEEQLSVHHRLRDNADGVRERGQRVAVCVRLVCSDAPAGSVWDPAFDE